MNKTIIASLVFLLSLLFISCSSNTESDASPVSFDPLHTNQEIRMYAPTEFNNFRPGDRVALFVVYNIEKADVEVVFPSNFNNRIFIKQGKEWAEINERDKIRLYDNVVLSPSKNRDLLIFTPILPDLNQRYEMRVYVFGEIIYPDGIQQVAAFIDFTLRP